MSTRKNMPDVPDLGHLLAGPPPAGSPAIADSMLVACLRRATATGGLTRVQRYYVIRVLMSLPASWALPDGRPFVPRSRLMALSGFRYRKGLGRIISALREARAIVKCRSDQGRRVVKGYAFAPIADGASAAADERRCARIVRVLRGALLSPILLRADLSSLATLLLSIDPKGPLCTRDPVPALTRLDGMHHSEAERTIGHLRRAGVMTFRRLFHPYLGEIRTNVFVEWGDAGDVAGGTIRPTSPARSSPPPLPPPPALPAPPPRSAPLSAQIDYAESLPIWEHVSPYRLHLEAQGCTARHVRQTMREIRVFLRLARVSYLSQLRPSSAAAAIAKLAAERPRRPQLSHRTINSYVGAAKAWAGWLVCDYRCHVHPLRSLRKLNVELDRRRERRPITPEELNRLLSAALNGPDVAGIPGYERFMCYVLAAETGFRAGEITSLTKGDFWLGDNPWVKVRAKYSKRRRIDIQPLSMATAEQIERYLATVDREAALFRYPKSNGTRGLKADLAAAGIPYVDESGRTFDVHGLRHQLASDLFASGASVREAQTLMRHSTAKLTQEIYAKATDQALRVAIERVAARQRKISAAPMALPALPASS